jgi:hypothetical protein
MFSILGDFTHGESCQCTGCSPVNPALWLIEAALLEVDPSLRQKLMATETGYSIDDDPFIKVELLLAGVMATSFGVAAAQAEDIIKTALHTKPLDRRRVADALDQANELLGDVIDEQTELRIEQYVDKLITDGANDAADVPRVAKPEPTPDPIPADPITGHHINALLAGLFVGFLARPRNIAKGTVLEGSPSTQLVYQGIVASAKYYTNNHFNTVIMPEIQRRVDILFADPLAQPDPTDLIAFLGRRLRSVPYWRVVANAAASRAYHYGAMKAGEILGVRAYALQAVLDERTSEICRELDGRVFWLADAVRLLERAAVASVEEIKQIMPWPRSVTGLTTEQLRDTGCMVPPFHGNCRTTIIFIR